MKIEACLDSVLHRDVEVWLTAPVLNQLTAAVQLITVTAIHHFGPLSQEHGFWSVGKINSSITSFPFPRSTWGDVWFHTSPAPDWNNALFLVVELLEEYTPTHPLVIRVCGVRIRDIRQSGLTHHSTSKKEESRVVPEVTRRTRMITEQHASLACTSTTPWLILSCFRPEMWIVLFTSQYYVFPF